MFTLYFMWDFIVRVVCEKECEDLRSHWRPSGFLEKIREKLSSEISHVLSTWLECEESWQLVFASNSQVRPSHEIPVKHSILLFFHICSTMSSSTLYISSLPKYCKEFFFFFYFFIFFFQRENLSIHTWELEIIIPTIIYTILYGFPLLLPLHIHILERLIV